MQLLLKSRSNAGNCLFFRVILKTAIESDASLLCPVQFSGNKPKRHAKQPKKPRVKTARAREANNLIIAAILLDDYYLISHY